jgi:hypothetical protein
LGFLFQSLVGGAAGEGAMGSIVVVVVLPFLEFVVEEVDVVDDLAFEEAVELFCVDPVGSLDLAVQAWCGGFDVDVADALSSKCQWNDCPNSDPLSVCTFSTLNGSFERTWSMNLIAVFWSWVG